MCSSDLGVAGAGKSTVSAHLMQQRGYTLVKFAAPLKAMCRAVGLTDDHIEGHLKEQPCDLLQGKSPRQFMQLLGTEFGRDTIGATFWTDLWMRKAREVLDTGGLVVVDDCRFPNEAACVRRLGGEIIRLSGRGGIAGGHASEAQNFFVDDVIENDGTIANLTAKIDQFLVRWA